MTKLLHIELESCDGCPYHKIRVVTMEQYSNYCGKIGVYGSDIFNRCPLPDAPTGSEGKSCEECETCRHHGQTPELFGQCRDCNAGENFEPKTTQNE